MLGVTPSDAVMIGDSSWDSEAAANAGCEFVGVAATDAGMSRFGKDLPTAPDLVEALDLGSRQGGAVQGR